MMLLAGEPSQVGQTNEQFLKRMLKELLSLPVDKQNVLLFLKGRQQKSTFDLFWVEQLHDYIVRYSFLTAKAIWQMIKETFMTNERYTPFIYLKEGEVMFSHGKEGENNALEVTDKDELLFGHYPVIVDPLYVQEKYHTNQQKKNDEMVTVSPLYIL